MGKHRSDDSDGDYSRRSKKKKKRRSRSSSNSESSHSRKSRRKHRKSSRSRSRSAVKRRTHTSRSSRRSRSSSTDRHSNSRKHRSVSRTSDRWGSKRSRSPPSRHGRSHSRSPSRRHNSHRHRSRSLSHSHRRVSRSHSKDSRSFSGERSHSQRHQTSSDNKPSGFSEMTPSEQAEERMRQAFKAAAAAGEKLKGQAVPSFTSSSLLESQNFAASVAAIDSDEFVASSFKSSRSNKIKDEPADGGYNHDDAIFGSLAISGFILTPDPDNKPIQFDGDSIVHPSLFCDPQEKMEKWITRLTQLRKRRLEGDVL